MAAGAEVQRVLDAKDHYSVLGCRSDAPVTEISRAYRKLSMALHPDKCQETSANDAFKKLAEAHAILCDPLQRRTYDRERQKSSNVASVGGIFSPQSSKSSSSSYNSFRAADQSQHAAPWAEPYPNRVPKPVWESPEDMVTREKAAIEFDKRQLQAECSLLQRELHDERRAAKERTKKHEHELAVQKRLASEAKASIERVKDHWQQKINEERQLHARQQSEMAARIKLLESEVAALRTQLAVRGAAERGRCEAGGNGSKAASNGIVHGPALPCGVSGPMPPASPASTPATTKSVEKDEHGNYCVVEKDAEGRYVVSRARLEAERKHCSSGAAHSSSQNGVGNAAIAMSGAVAKPESPVDTMTVGLVELLESIDLSQYRDQLEEEELLDTPLLRSMGPHLAANMSELGMTTAEIERLTRALAL